MIDSFTDIISKADKNGKLILKNIGAKSLPKSNLCVSFNDIYYLDISENKFTSIPEVISEFQCLEMLFCSHNNIRSLSYNINNLIYLETLDLSCNHLTSLHSSIGKLECLKILLISNNRLVSLPKSIGALKSLEELDASCNSLTCLPDELALLKQLKFLNLRHNKLLDVPTNLSTLSIEIFDLSENQLSSIPSEYHRIESLQSFNLSGNPITSPPANVCNRGLLHIIKYLQSEYRRQNQRQHTKPISQIGTECSTFTRTEKSDIFQLNTNPCDSVISSSNTSFPTTLVYEFESNPKPPTTESVKRGTLPFSDSGYNSLLPRSFKSTDAPDKSLTSEKPRETSPNHMNTSNSISSNRIANQNSLTTMSPSGHLKDGSGRSPEKNFERQFKKNKNYTSSSGPLSPQMYRSIRFNSRIRNIDPGKTRRNSLPNDDFAPVPETYSNHDVENSSECVVVVENNNNTEVLTTNSSQETLLSRSAQSNNSNSSSFSTASYNSLRSMKSRNSDHYTERRRFPPYSSGLAHHSSSRIPEQEPTINDEINQANQQAAIIRFHKIIKAQLHVQIHLKDLSQELSNGIYLCHLANYLIPNSIAFVHTPSPGQRELGRQKSKRNMDNFLETCRRNGVSEDNLFAARDVINCNPASLLQVANSVEALMQSIRINKSAKPLTSNCKPWREVLANPHSLSKRGLEDVMYPPPRSMSGTSSDTMHRLNRSVNNKYSSGTVAISNSNKAKHSKSGDDIIQISSEV